ncbi:MAG: NADH:flavin oxidoreductase [Gaiellales bacterium]|nr:MAG: NADH:flavin oxidoreductase [Gaiellales bacterium]
MPKLSDSLTIKGVTLRNRIVMPPMANDLSDESGAVTSRHLDHYRARAEAEVGLIIVEHSYITPRGKMTAPQLGIHDDGLVPGLRGLADTIRAGGAASAIQLTHAGANTTAEIIGCQPVGPADVAVPGRGVEPRPLSADELSELIGLYRDAARRAIEAGFDAIEIHGAHGFLLSEFLSPYTNRRTDEYGGSLENRLRFPLEVITAVREVAGPDYPLLYRFGASDFMQEGLALDEAREAAPRLVGVGIDILDVSGGLCGSRPKDLSGVQGFYVPLAESIKSVVDVPVIAVGGIREASFANSVIEDGRADLVAVGRELLKNPDWAREALASLQ